MNKKVVLFLQGLFVLSIVTLFSLIKVEDVKAATNIDLSDTNVTLTDGVAYNDIDWNSIMSSLDGQALVDGSRILVGDSYIIECAITVEPTTNSTPSTSENALVETPLTSMAPSIGALSNLTGALAATSSTTNTYTAACSLSIYFRSSYTHVATLTHSVTIIYFDNNLIHISSGSLSVSTYDSYWSGTAYGYSITNTDGTYSYSSGMVQLYDSYDSLYYYYGSAAYESPGSTPTFTFTQI